MTHCSPAVTVIDAIMGAGKTTWAFDMMNRTAVEAMFPQSDSALPVDRPRFIYVTPFLKEIERVQEECPLLDFREPQKLDETPKWVHFEWLLKEGHNIATTHALFPFLSNDGVSAIREHGYRLIIDEALSTFEVYKSLKIPELEWLVHIEAIQVCQWDGRIDWTLDQGSGELRGHRFDEVKRMAKAGSLFLMDGKCVIWEFPKKALDAFAEITVLTYLFEASTLAPFLRSNGYRYQVLGIDPATKELKDRDTINEAAAKKAIRSRLKVYDGSKNRVGAFRDGKGRGSQKFTKRHLDKRFSKEEQRRLSRSVTKWIERDAGVPSSEVAFTTYKKHRDSLKGPRYIDPECFIPLNARASNDWKHKRAMIYLANRYPNPMLKTYIERKGETIDHDLMALSEMLQWLWRGCIRVDGGPIMHVFIPSERMRNLLQVWLETDTLSELYERLGSGYMRIPKPELNPIIPDTYRPHP